MVYLCARGGRVREGVAKSGKPEITSKRCCSAEDRSLHRKLGPTMLLEILLCCYFQLHLVARGQELRLSPTGENSSVLFYTRGDTLTLTCTLYSEDGSEVPDNFYTVAWCQNNVPVESLSNGTLRIENSSFGHGGWYTCSTSYRRRRYQLDFLLVFGGSPKLETNLTPPTYEVQEGTRVEFPCIYRGLPYPSFTWYYKEGKNDMVAVSESRNIIINKISHSLIIINATEENLKGRYICQVQNSYTSNPVESHYSANITTAPRPSSGPQFPAMTDDGTTTSFRLNCTNEGILKGNESVMWYRNGTRLEVETNATLIVERGTRGSGFYCCKIYNSFSQDVLDTHCITVLFKTRPNFEPPTLPFQATYNLLSGTRAGFICRGVANTTLAPPFYYDFPDLVWTGPSQSVVNINDSDHNGFTHIMVDINSKNSGTYFCSGSNSIGNINTNNISINYIDRNLTLESSDFLYNEEGWRSGGNARIETYMNDRVFLLRFVVGESVGETWMSQEFNLTSNYSSFSISGRVRQSDNETGVYPVIEVLRNNESVDTLEHPARRSLAWQWIRKTFLHQGTKTYTVRLALRSNGNSDTVKRQANSTEEMAFFGDINVDVQSAPAEENDEDLFIIIVASASAGGGLLLIILVVLLVVCCLFRKRGKEKARPMRKITTLVKKVSQRYMIPSNEREKVTSPAPMDYETPVDSYATIQQGRVNNDVDDNSNEYTAINPSSLDEPSYYTSTFTGRPGKNADVGGVNAYLEVVPPTGQRSSPGSSRGGSPKRPTGLATQTAQKTTKQGEIVPSPDVLDGDTIEMYEYVNADLGPAL